MSDDEELKASAAEFLAKLRAEEAEKEMLYDRTIGGDRVPRPSTEYIERCVGPLKSDIELREAAEQAAMKERQRLLQDQEFKQNEGSSNLKQTPKQKL